MSVVVCFLKDVRVEEGKVLLYSFPACDTIAISATIRLSDLPQWKATAQRDLLYFMWKETL